jgi:hypothetical protein
MGLLQFNALRRLMPGRTSGEVVSLEVGFTDESRGREVRKHVHRSVSGLSETIYVSADTKWSLEFEPVTGDALARLQEFLASTAGGETFYAWPYGTEEEPLSLRRADTGYQPSRFAELGDAGLDPVTIRVEAIEV